MKTLTLACLFFFSVSVHAAPVFDPNAFGADRDREFQDLVSNLDLEDPRAVFENKTSGTSLGLKISFDGKKIGKWLPENSAANPEAQQVSYKLGLLLGSGDLVPAVTYFQLKGRALREFAILIQARSEKNKWRMINQQSLLKKLAQNSESMDGVLIEHVKDNREVEELTKADQNTINSNHPLAQMIRAEGPFPQNKLMTFRGFKTKEGKAATNTELALASQLSQILILDCLTGQFDRWSGGNVEAVVKKSGMLNMIARDNGGGSMVGTSWCQAALNKVTRFDRKQVQALRLLQLYLEESPTQVTQFLGLRSPLRHLKTRVEMALQHIRLQEQRFGDSAFFP